jgi:hypothetical protein
MMIIVPLRNRNMQLDVYVGDRMYPIEVTQETLDLGMEFFDKIDRDMDGGWRMGPEYIERPDRVQRGQIVASRLLVAIETGNEMMVRALAGYFASRLPEVRSVNINLEGEALNTDLVTDTGQSLMG